MIDPQTLTIVGLAILLLLAFIVANQPIWLGLGLSGAIGLVLLDGPSVAINTIGSLPYVAASNYALVIVPMFILMGVFASRAGLAVDMFTIGQRLTSKVPGGLGVATILACGGFSAVAGSSVATVATVGKIAIDEMRQRGYSANSAAAIVAAGGTLGVLIPPSIILVVYASLVGESVSRLLLAGVIPGLITIVVYSTFVIVLSWRGVYAATEREQRFVEDFTDGIRRAGREDAAELAEAQGEHAVVVDEADPGALPPRDDDGRVRLTRRNLAGAGYVGILFVAVIGGIYSGWFTATESGAIAAAIALIILVIRLRGRGGGRRFHEIRDATLEAVSLTSMIFALVVGGAIFAYFLVKTGIPTILSRNILASGLSAEVVVVIAVFILIVLGFFLDGYSILVIAIPLMWPILSGLDVNAVWFGILAVKAVEIGMLTPPFGINVFVVSSVSPHVTVDGTFKAVLPLVAAEFVVVVILFAFPELVTWLPALAESG